MYVVAFLIIFQTQFIHAQEDRASNNDLRGRQVLFTIEHKGHNYSLTRSSAGDHSLIMGEKDKLKHTKISSQTAGVLDDEIAAEFINLKYFMGELKTCKKPAQIEMRGEKLSVCPDDKKRVTKVAQLVKTIESSK